MSPNHFDVAIIGAGPAGSACAYWLATAGIRVALIEKSIFPRAKTCGDGLTPRAVRQLFDMGLETSFLAKHRCLGLRAHAYGREIHLPWPKQKGYPHHGYIVGRAELDHLVASHAERAGAEFLPGHKVVDVQRSEGTVQSLIIEKKSDRARTSISARYFVIADGTKGRVGAMFGTQRDREYPLGMAVRQYFNSPRHNAPEMESYLDISDHCGRALPAYGWVFPLGDGRINVGVGLLSTTQQWKSVNTSHLMDAFTARLDPSWGVSKDSSCSKPEGGRLPTGFSMKPRVGSNFICVGDAAGAINPFNGEGISYAYETGRLASGVLARACREEIASLDEYESLLTRHYGRYYRFGRIFVALMGKPQVMRLCVQTGFRAPWVMKMVLRVMSNLFDKPIVFADAQPLKK